VNDVQEASCENQIYEDSSGKTNDKNFFPNKTKHSIYDLYSKHSIYDFYFRTVHVAILILLKTNSCTFL
jgi:hypothetical protein